MNRTTPPPSFARPAFVLEARKVFDDLLARHPDIASVDAVLADVNGMMRGKRFPVGEIGRVFEAGMQIPHSVYLMDPRGEMTSPFGRGFGDGDPDGTAWPIAETIGLAWVEGPPRAQMLMTLYDDAGAVDAADSRAALARVLERFAELRLTPVAAVELEYYVIDPVRDPNGAPQPPSDFKTGLRDGSHSVYETDDLDRYAAFLAALDDASRVQGLPLTATSSEYGPGQFETNLRHQADALRAGDHAIFLKQIVKNAARATGYDATFMAKPYPDKTGSGQHVHVSVLDESGRNIFADGSAGGSTRLRHAVGGLQALMAESMALFAPSVNSYRRFQPDMFAPVNTRWGVNNRSVGLRIPIGPDDARRVEHRAAGADANPYFVLAAVLAGIHHGLERKLDPGAPATGNVSHEPDSALAHTIEDALAALGKAKVLPQYLGEETVSLYREGKRLELVRFRKIVPAHEYEWYL